MNRPSCPECTLSETLAHAKHWECGVCGFEWPKTAAELGPLEVDGPRVVKDANGTVLADGDTVVLIKDLKLRGSTGVIKGGTKAKNIRLVDGDHEIDCKIDGAQIGLKAEFVKKA
jgi:protein PhnA